MPTNTYIALKKETVAVAASSVTIDLTGITDYTDLELVANVQTSASGVGLSMQFNNDNGTGSLYSNVGLRGNGSTSTSFKQSNNTNIILSNTAVPPTSGSFGYYNAKFLNYANANVFKTVLVRGSSADGVDMLAELWRNTNAITSIKITASSGNISVGSTFSVYGIKAVGGDTGVKALGGVITEDATYYYHTFKGSGSFTPLQSLSADILVVAGGGGAMGAGGGGGGGGLLGFAAESLTAQNYQVIVGAGGTRAKPGNGFRTSGNDSKFGSLTTALGGAGGGGYNEAAGAYQAALSGGGSGGGGSYYSGISFSAGTAGQGNSGSNGRQGTGGGEPRSGGGGGGAGGAAASGSDAVGGNGGIGATYNSTVGGSAGPYAFINAMGAASGTGQLSSGNYYYAGGGGGEGKNSRGAAGLGGGGQGGTSEPSVSGDAGTAFTGGGAGAGPNTSSSYGGNNGGSGVVIVRYAKA